MEKTLEELIGSEILYAISYNFDVPIHGTVERVTKGGYVAIADMEGYVVWYPKSKISVLEVLTDEDGPDPPADGWL